MNGTGKYLRIDAEGEDVMCRKNGRFIKKMIAGFLVVTMVGVLNAPIEADASEKGQAVEIPETVYYEPYTGTDAIQTFQDSFGVQNKIPVKEGYLFGGWYEDTNGETPIKTTTQANDIKSTETVYAKFVPAYVLSVKAQIHSNTTVTDDNSGKTNVRLVSSVNSTEYKNVGFDITVDGQTKNPPALNDVYESLVVTNKDKSTKTFTPKQLFGKASDAFIVLNFKNIPEAYWNVDDSITNEVYVQPYWTTHDGVKVYGLGKYVYVEDGLNGTISVPVNLHTANNVAAGLVSVGYDNTNLEYKGYVAGRVFEEMKATVNGATVNCVGNVAEIKNSTANDMYITLRFSLKNEYSIGNGETFLNFTMSNIDFCDIDEEPVSVNIQNVQY